VVPGFFDDAHDVGKGIGRHAVAAIDDLGDGGHRHPGPLRNVADGQPPTGLHFGRLAPENDIDND
jgi:hypothetical protein